MRSNADFHSWNWVRLLITRLARLVSKADLSAIACLSVTASPVIRNIYVQGFVLCDVQKSKYLSKTHFMETFNTNCITIRVCPWWWRCCYSTWWQNGVSCAKKSKRQLITLSKKNQKTKATQEVGVFVGLWLTRSSLRSLLSLCLQPVRLSRVRQYNKINWLRYRDKCVNIEVCLFLFCFAIEPSSENRKRESESFSEEAKNCETHTSPTVAGMGTDDKNLPSYLFISDDSYFDTRMSMSSSGNTVKNGEE